MLMPFFIFDVLHNERFLEELTGNIPIFQKGTKKGSTALFTLNGQTLPFVPVRTRLNYRTQVNEHDK